MPWASPFTLAIDLVFCLLASYQQKPDRLRTMQCVRPVDLQVKSIYPIGISLFSINLWLPSAASMPPSSKLIILF